MSNQTKTTIKNYLTLFLLCAFLCACTHTEQADPRDLPPVGATDKEAYAVNIGTIDGETVWYSRPSIEESNDSKNYLKNLSPQEKF